MFTQLNQYHVVLEVKPEFQQDPVSLRNIFIRRRAQRVDGLGGGRGRGGAGIRTIERIGQRADQRGVRILGRRGHGHGGCDQPRAGARRGVFVGLLRTKARCRLALSPVWSRLTVPITVNHQGQFPVVTLSFNLAPNVALGDAVKAVNKVKDELDMPASIQAAFQGTAEAFQASLANELVLILAAIVTVYIVLGVLYESYIHPITILSTLPSAGVGALLALYICHNDFSVIALIGIVLLIGIVKKNAIMMIDFALDAERKEGMTPVNAIYQACLLRFRPIMMTTMAALLGGVPLALGTGTGSELRRPLGITIVGGLILSQLLTLYTTPVIYLWFDRLAKRFSPSARDSRPVRNRFQRSEP